MKHIVFLCLPFFIISCSNSSTEKLEKENMELKEQLETQEEKLEMMTNSLVIPYDSLSYYMMPSTCSASGSDVKNPTFITTLVWNKLPQSILVDFEIENGKAKLVDRNYSSLNRHIEYSEPINEMIDGNCC